MKHLIPALVAIIFALVLAPAASADVAIPGQKYHNMYGCAEGSTPVDCEGTQCDQYKNDPQYYAALPSGYCRRDAPLSQGAPLLSQPINLVRTGGIIAIVTVLALVGLYIIRRRRHAA